MKRITTYDDFIINLVENTNLIFQDVKKNRTYDLTLIETIVNTQQYIYSPDETKIDISSSTLFAQKIIDTLFRKEQRTDFDRILQTIPTGSPGALLRWTDSFDGGLVINTHETRARGMFFYVYVDNFKPISPGVDNFIFDLDLTLTIKHTGGMYVDEDVNTIIDIPRIKTMLKTLLNKNVFLCSRGQYNSCYELLKRSGLLSYFCGIYGALQVDGSDETLLREDPVLNNLDLTYDYISAGTERWTILKSEFVTAIMNNFKNSFTKIYYFDDTKENIDTVTLDNRSNNIVNTIYISQVDNRENYKQTIESVKLILVPDETTMAQGSVRTAMAYFSTNPYKIIRIYSARHRYWYYNPNPEKPIEFIGMSLQLKPPLSSVQMGGNKNKQTTKKRVKRRTYKKVKHKRKRNKTKKNIHTKRKNKGTNKIINNKKPKK